MQNDFYLFMVGRFLFVFEKTDKNPITEMSHPQWKFHNNRISCCWYSSTTTLGDPCQEDVRKEQTIKFLQIHGYVCLYEFDYGYGQKRNHGSISKPQFQKFEFESTKRFKNSPIKIIYFIDWFKVLSCVVLWSPCLALALHWNIWCSLEISRVRPILSYYVVCLSLR